jgi:hypothetical protein
MYMMPMLKFLRGLQGAQLDFKETFEELIGFAEILANKRNTLELDEDGLFYSTATGNVDEMITILKDQLKKLERIKEQKDMI